MGWIGGLRIGGSLQSGDCEGGEGFVKAADHYAGFIGPVGGGAAVGKGTAQVPG